MEGWTVFALVGIEMKLCPFSKNGYLLLGGVKGFVVFGKRGVFFGWSGEGKAVFCSVGNEIFSLLKYKEGIFCQFIEDRILPSFYPIQLALWIALMRVRAFVSSSVRHT